LVDLTIDLTNLSLDTDSHDWTFGDGNSDNTEDPVHTYLEGGTYTITLIASNDCGVDTANVTLGIMNIGVEEASGISEFSMYPNPVHDKLVMDLTLIEHREMNIEFFDGLGQVVMSEQNELVAGSNKLEFNLGHLAQGVYSVKISDEQFTQVVRLVKR
jgi:PKD repeat protein